MVCPVCLATAIAANAPAIAAAAVGGVAAVKLAVRKVERKKLPVCVTLDGGLDERSGRRVVPRKVGKQAQLVGVDK